MKKFLPLIVLSFVLGCHNSEAKPVSCPVPSPIKQVKSREVPKGFKEVKELNASFLIPTDFEMFKNDNVYVNLTQNVRIVLEHEPTKLNTVEYAKSALETLPEEIKLVKAGIAKAGDDDAVFALLKYEDYDMIQVLISKNGEAYILGCGGKHDVLEEIATICPAVISSLKIE